MPDNLTQPLLTVTSLDRDPVTDRDITTAVQLLADVVESLTVTDPASANAVADAAETAPVTPDDTAGVVGAIAENLSEVAPILTTAARALLPGMYAVAVDDGIDPHCYDAGGYPILRDEVEVLALTYVEGATNFRWLAHHLAAVDVGDVVWQFGLTEIG